MTEGRLTAWRTLASPGGHPLLAAIEAAEDHGPALLGRLRSRFDRTLVEVALDLCAARRKAKAKFVDVSELLCDVSGIEQATGQRVADHKAERFRSAPAVVDLCSGIGGDAMSLARVCSSVTVSAVDRNSERAFMTGHNAKIEASPVDIGDAVLDPSAWVHLDPSRREEASGRRRWRYADYEPGPDVVESLVSSAPAAGVKLGPGIDWRELPCADERELEFVSDRGQLVQAVMWSGALCRAPGSHTATRLGPEGTETFTARPDEVLYVEERHRGFLLVPDPALERAHLVAPRVADSAAAELAPGLGILVADEPLDDPWFEQHEILAVLPWREAKIRDWLKSHDGGIVTVRTRDKAVPTDSMQVTLRGEGATPFTLFGLRLGKRVACIITR